MAKLTAIPGGKGKEKTYTLVYGLRLYSGDDITQVEAGEVPLHIIEGTRDQIRAQLLTSIDAFFDIHTDDAVPAPANHQTDEVEETGC